MRDIDMPAFSFSHYLLFAARQRRRHAIFDTSYADLRRAAMILLFSYARDITIATLPLRCADAIIAASALLLITR